MSDSLEETIRMNRLIDIYGSLLSSSQQAILIDYFCENLSISEISSLRNISRAAVFDSLYKGKEKLEYFEKEIGICRVFDKFKDKDETHKKITEELEEELKDGI